MESRYYKRGGFETDKQGCECNEKPWKRYLERDKKQPELYEDQIVVEMSLSKIMAGKQRIKRDAKMREEYKEIKLHSDGGTYRAVDFVNAVKSVTLSQMEAALKALQRDLAKSSTGKACLGMADHIFVETNGVKIPLSEMADVSFYEPRHNPHILSIAPYDPNTIQKLEKAISESPLGMSPSVRGERLEAFVSTLTFKQMQDVWNLVIYTCEQYKQSIRKIRKKARATIKISNSKKKEKERIGFTIACLSADDVKKLEKEVDEMTKKYLESIEEICNTKYKEIVEW